MPIRDSATEALPAPPPRSGSLPASMTPSLSGGYPPTQCWNRPEFLQNVNSNDDIRILASDAARGRIAWLDPHDGWPAKG